jgi:hypothetical protein
MTGRSRGGLVRRGGRPGFFRTTMRFETGAQDLAWLNKTIAVASAERKVRQVELQAWRLL